MKTNEFDYYSKLANWSFDNIDYTSEIFTNWIYEKQINKHTNKHSKILDLGTASGTHNELLKKCSSYKKLYESEIKENLQAQII